MHHSQNLQEYFERNFATYMEYHRQMVEINSYTTNPIGVNKLGKLTAELFSNFGFNAEFIQSVNPGYGKHLILTQPDVNKNVNPAIAFISHLDTVFSPEEEQSNNFIWRIEGDNIYGPGSVDIKGGTILIYMVLDAIKEFFPAIFKEIDWTILLNASEETLSPDFGHLCRQRIPPNALACLVFEGGTLASESYSLVVSRKGRATFKLKAEGRSAHAGNNHAIGANAIIQIAHTVLKIAGFTDYDKQITFNVGTIQGGTVVNRVPHFAEAEVEMRAFDPEIFKEGIYRIIALNGSSQVSSEDGYQSKIIVEQLEKTLPWPVNEETLELFDLWAKTASDLGKDIIQEHRGGLSDGNWIWNHCRTLDGLGPNGANAHCSEKSQNGTKDQEYAVLSSFIPKAILNVLAIIRLIELSNNA